MVQPSPEHGRESEPNERLALGVPNHLVASRDSLEAFLKLEGELSTPDQNGLCTVIFPRGWRLALDSEGNHPVPECVVDGLGRPRAIIRHGDHGGSGPAAEFVLLPIDEM